MQSLPLLATDGPNVVARYSWAQVAALDPYRHLVGPIGDQYVEAHGGGHTACFLCHGSGLYSLVGLAVPVPGFRAWLCRLCCERARQWEVVVAHREGIARCSCWMPRMRDLPGGTKLDRVFTGEVNRTGAFLHTGGSLAYCLSVCDLYATGGLKGTPAAVITPCDLDLLERWPAMPPHERDAAICAAMGS